MMSKFDGYVRAFFQKVIIFVAKPYVSRELPGWGRVYSALVGDYRRDTLWRDCPEKITRGKFHPYLMHLNLSHWADRSAFFLNRWYELETQLFMKDVVKPGDTVVDIGANRGMFTLCASHFVGTNGKVISFEPNPVSRKLLEREIEANEISNVSVLPYGASNVPMVLTLDVPLLNSGEATFGKKLRVKNSFYQVEVQVVTADSQLMTEAPTLIKIDVEGFECRVIEGLTETLKKHHPVVFTEIVEEHLKACGADSNTLIQLLNNLGYSGYSLNLIKSKGLYDWDVKPISNASNSYNAVWLHKKSNTLALEAITSHIRPA